MEGRRAVAVAGLGVAAAAAAALAFAATTRRLRPDDGATRDESDRPLHITVGDMELLDRAFNGLVPAAAQTEHDALHTAEFVRSMLHGQTSGKHVLVLVGSGGNGAAGLATARRLLAWGTSVTVVLCAGRQKLKGYAKEAIAAIDAMGALSPRLCRVLDASEVADECTAVPGVGATWSAAVASERLFGPDSRGVPVDLMIDAIFGYSLRGPPRPLQAAVVKAANAHPSPVVAIGVPSGPLRPPPLCGVCSSRARGMLSLCAHAHVRLVDSRYMYIITSGPDKRADPRHQQRVIDQHPRESAQDSTCRGGWCSSHASRRWPQSMSCSPRLEHGVLPRGRRWASTLSQTSVCRRSSSGLR